MTWTGGGVVRLPLKHVYLWLIVLLTAYFIAREISMTQRRRNQASCSVFQANLLKDTRETGENLHIRSDAAKRDGEDADQDSDLDIGDDVEIVQKNVCKEKPVQNELAYCWDCFRPRAHVLSKKLKPLSYSPLMFPRGPPDLFKLRNTKQQSFVTEYPITPWAVCRHGRRCPFLLAVQLSLAEDFERRRAVRTTWGSAAKTQLWPNAILNGEVQLVFVLGHQTSSTIRQDTRSKQKPREPPAAGAFSKEKLSPSQRLQKELKKEAETHGDILYVDMLDSYFNLTLKLMSAFKWVRDHCQSVKFVLKVDTDTFVNVPLLVDLLMLNEERLQYSITGTIYKQERTVHRRDKWAVNASVYPPPIYPVYASGCSYVISASALSQMVEASPYMVIDHTSTFLGPDFYATGVMGLLLSFEFYDIPGTHLFGRCNDTQWNPCDMIMDNRVFGIVSHSPINLTYVTKIWRSFYRYYGHSR